MHGAYSTFKPIWTGALLCFLVAGITGMLFRVAMIGHLPLDLHLANIRHAHSHLMFFGWVTPAIMALIASHTSPRRDLVRITWATLALGLAAYLPFLLYGYSVAEIGSLRLPLSITLSTLNIIAWYAFAGVYWLLRRSIENRLARRFWDGAIGMLILSSMGAWSLGMAQMAGGATSFWYTASLHLFLDLFAEGWLVLAVLGFAVATIRPGATNWCRRGLQLMLAGLPFTFLLGMSVDTVPAGLRLLGGAGGIAASLGLLLVIATLWQAAPPAKRWRWAVPMILFALVAVARMALTVPAFAEWAYAAGLRLLYLHMLLLGGVTLGLLASAAGVWGAAAARGWEMVTGAVLFLLLTLVPLSGVWPAAWGGMWTYYLAIVGAAAPVIAMAILAVRIRSINRRPAGTLRAPA